VPRFDVSHSGFYAWANAKPSQRVQEDARLKVAIEAVHAQSRQRYGPLRMQPELTAQGFPVGRDRIVRLRREQQATGSRIDSTFRPWEPILRT
jgi:transposase InsO family protein